MSSAAAATTTKDTCVRVLCVRDDTDFRHTCSPKGAPCVQVFENVRKFHEKHSSVFPRIPLPRLRTSSCSTRKLTSIPASQRSQCRSCFHSLTRRLEIFTYAKNQTITHRKYSIIPVENPAVARKIPKTAHSDSRGKASARARECFIIILCLYIIMLNKLCLPASPE